MKISPFLLIIIFLGCKQERISYPNLEVEKPKVRTFQSISPDYDTTQWTEIIENEVFSLDIRYASTNNFMKQKVYDCGRCFLDKSSYKALLKASTIFSALGYKLILYDCYRPKDYQQRLWDIMPNAMYVTPPNKGSMHSRGRAIDLSLQYLDGSSVDMGTDYDHFGQKAHYSYSKSSEKVKNNRKILRQTMMSVGFTGIRTEWWHFSFQNSKSPFSNWLWNCD